MCVGCGAGLAHGDTKAWSQGVYFCLLILSLFIPIFGFIYGGIKFSQAAERSERKRQSRNYIICSAIGLFLVVLVS